VTASGIELGVALSSRTTFGESSALANLLDLDALRAGAEGSEPL